MSYESGKELSRSGPVHQLLVVVGDPDLMNLIRRYCAGLPCQTMSTESPDEALSMLGSSKISLVLADQHLRTMSGTQLLKEVARRSPLTARVLLASYPENHDIAENDGERLHGIIGKPWDGPSLQRTILAILEWQEERSRQPQKQDETPPSYNTPTRSIRHLFGHGPAEGRRSAGDRTNGASRPGKKTR